MISFKGFLRRFLSDPVAIGAGLVLLVLVLMAVLAPFLAPQDPYDLMQLDIMDSELPPSWKPGGDERFRVTANDPAELVECRDANNTAETTASCSILF